MAGPWEKYGSQQAKPWERYSSTPEQMNAAEGLPADFPRHLPGDTTGDWWKKEFKSMTYPQTWKRQALLAGRSVVDAVQALPLTAMDMGVSARNMLTGSNYQMPSQMSRESLNTVAPEARTPQEKTATFVETLLAGSRLPAPQLANQAPAGFVPPKQAAKDAVLRAAQKEGYVTPPSANNPTIGNRMLEGIAGKQKVGQEAIIRNQPVTDTLVSRSLGQNPDSPITQGSLQIIRNEAYKAGYEPVKAAGEIRTDGKFLNDLVNVTKTGADASRSFAGLKPKTEIDDTVNALLQDKFDAGDGIDAVKYLRELADEAYGGGKKQLGGQYKSAAKAIEDMIERSLSARGEDGGKLLANFKAARTQIAKTHTAGKALADDIGSSNARTYALELIKQKPLTGDQRLIGQFASSFGKYTSKPTGENFPAISPLDVYGSAAVSATTDSALPLMYPLTRTALREYLLSQAGQARAFAKPVVPRQTIGATGALPIALQEALLAK